MNKEHHFGIVILAAGNSSRLGQPKQLLQYNGKTLIRNVIDAATQARLSPVTVVTGANAALLSAEINDSSTIVVHNKNWEEGMSSSIRTGITALDNTSSLQGIILAVSDQPFVDSHLFLSLVQKAQSSEKGIIASFYDDSLGTPVLFGKQYFDALLELKGAEGAKKLIKQFRENVASVPFALGGIDIDTQEDYRKLNDM
jgi:molybdenum cofactor cytidylyltransferase